MSARTSLSLELSGAYCSPISEKGVALGRHHGTLSGCEICTIVNTFCQLVQDLTLFHKMEKDLKTLMDEMQEKKKVGINLTIAFVIMLEFLLDPLSC